MSKTENEDNFKKYQASLASNIVPINSVTPPDWIQALKDGFEILDKEAKNPAPKSDPGTELKKILTADVSNPYAKARIKVLVELPSFHKKEIERMEATGDKDNYRYKEFVRMIIEEAEKTC